MKRRGFLGVLAGGAVAGPAAAKQAVTAASKSMSGGVASLGLGSGPIGMSLGEEPSSGSHKSYLLESVARYKRILSGQLTDEEIEERRVDSEIRQAKFEIETSGLRSMSESVKYARMHRYVQARRDERERFYAARQLSRYLKELAGLE